MLDANYIVGLVDGEGSFTVYVRNLKNRVIRKRRARIEPKFYLKLVEDDKKILYELKKFFGCGNVYYQKDSRPNHKHCYRYEVSNRKDLVEVVVPFFEKHQPMFPSKVKDFRIFCQIMRAIQKGDHLKDCGLAKLFKLKQKMH